MEAPSFGPWQGMLCEKVGGERRRCLTSKGEGQRSRILPGSILLYFIVSRSYVLPDTQEQRAGVVWASEMLIGTGDGEN